MFAAGMTLFVAGYGADIGLSYGLNVQRPALSFIPVFGPLAQMGQSWAVVPPAATGNTMVDAEANSRIARVNDATQTVAYVVLSLDCAIQLAGVALAVVGALPPRKPKAVPSDRGAARLGLAPMGVGRMGLAVTF
jgi:hypothetical protein